MNERIQFKPHVGKVPIAARRDSSQPEPRLVAGDDIAMGAGDARGLKPTSALGQQRASRVRGHYSERRVSRVAGRLSSERG